MSEQTPESFADWVDGRLSPEEQSSFETRMREDDEFRQAAEDYRETVRRIRSLRADSDDRSPDDFVDVVMAEVDREAASTRMRNRIPFFASVATAAAMLVLYLVLGDVLSGVNQSPEIRSVATGSEKELAGSDLLSDSPGARARQAQGRLEEGEIGEMELPTEQSRDSLKKLDGIVRVMDVTEVDPAGGITAGELGSDAQALAESEKSSTAPVASADRGAKRAATSGPATPAPSGPARKVANSLPGQPPAAEASPRSDDDSLASRWGESASTGPGSLVLVLTLSKEAKELAESFSGHRGRPPVDAGRAGGASGGGSVDESKARRGRASQKATEARPLKDGGRVEEVERENEIVKTAKKLADKTDPKIGEVSEESFKRQIGLDAMRAENLEKSRAVTGGAGMTLREHADTAEKRPVPTILFGHADRNELAEQVDVPNISSLSLNEGLLAALARIKSKKKVAGEYRWSSGDEIYVVAGDRTAIKRYLNSLQQDAGRRGGKLELERSAPGSLITGATEKFVEEADAKESTRPVRLLIVVRWR